MKTQAVDSLKYANSYFSTVSHELESSSRRFDNDLLYNMICMSFEKFFVSLLARYDWNSESHLPLRMYKEAQPFESELTENMKKTAILIGSFEAICSIDGFGYKSPSNDDLATMVSGLNEIRELVEKRISEIN